MQNYAKFLLRGVFSSKEQILFRVYFYNWPVSHSARHQRPARERHRIRIASRENVDNQAPRNTNFTH